MIEVERVLKMVFKLAFIPDDKDFMLQLADFAFTCLNDRLSDEWEDKDKRQVPLSRA